MQQAFLIESVDITFPGTLFQVCKFYQVAENAVRTPDLPIFHRHVYYEMHFITSGACDFVLQDKCVTVSGGQLFLIPPEVKHYSVLQSDTSDRIVLSVLLQKTAGGGFYEYFRSSMAQAALTAVTLPAGFMRHFQQMNEITGRGSLKNYCYMKRMVCDVLVELFDALNGFAPTGKAGFDSTQKLEKERLAMLLEPYVNDENYALSDIAQILHYSPRHTARMIESIYGRTLRDCRSLLMLERAEKYLEKGKSVQQAAELSGLKSVERLRKCMKKHRGITPSQYQKQVKNNGK